MGPSNEPLGFRDITEVYRRELRAREISEVRPDFYQAVQALLRSLREESEEEMCNDPLSLKALSISDTLKKAQAKVTQIFEIRAEKVLIMALRASSGTTVSIQRLTREEKALYNQTLSALNSCRSSALAQEGRPPEELEPIVEAAAEAESGTQVEPEQEAEAEPEPEAQELPEEVQGIPEEVQEIPEEETVEPWVEGQVETGSEEVERPHQGEAPIETGPEEEYLVVRVMEDIPSFAGPEKDYQLSREDVVVLRPGPGVQGKGGGGKGKVLKGQGSHLALQAKEVMARDALPHRPHGQFGGVVVPAEMSQEDLSRGVLQAA